MQPAPLPRSPLAHDASPATSSSSSSSLANNNLSRAPNTPGGGPASPPYLSVHPSRTPYGTGAAIGASQAGFAASSSTSRPPPLRIPSSPGRAHTHRILSAGTQQPPTPPFLPPGARDFAQTPPARGNTSGNATTPSAAGQATGAPPAAAPTNNPYAVPLASPCFVHSHLDPNLNGSAAATAATIKAKKKARARPAELAHDAMAKRTGDEAAADKTPPRTIAGTVPGSVFERDGNEEEDAEDDEEEDEDDEGDSEDERNTWTRQLAETAVSVREMSRQLGRARVVSHIQSVMIVTKARDNQLTKLTRELALYLMKTPRDGKDRGLVVYVDSQLRKSKRFDSEGIERDNPELFRPLPHRRYSRSSSSASLATDVGPLRANGAATPAGNGRGTLTPLTMTNLGEALVKRNNSIGGSDSGGRPYTPSSRRSQGNGHGQGHESEEGQLRYWTNDMCRKSPHLFDFVITLGGDGTVLYTSWLFQQVVPPVIPFALGSLGFLTNFDYADFRPTLDAAIETGVRVNLRMRFTCTVYRAVDEGDDSKCRRQAIRSGKTGGIFMKSLTREGWEAIENGKPLPQNSAGKGKDKAIKCFSTRPVESFEVLNDLVVDRGPSPYVSQLELFGDEHHMTTVQADGLTVSTPTGSTAYSLSAGGSLVHPEIPAILITPICPHTLSFRPMLLPDSMELRICVPYNSRSTAWASFDGRGRVELRQGDHIKVTASPYPFPTVCADKQSTDWFHSIARTLKWNERQRQKSFVILEEGRKKPRSSDVGEPSTKSSDRTKEKARSPLSSVPPTTGKSASQRGEEAGGSAASSSAVPTTKRATFADSSALEDRIGEDDEEEDEDEVDDEEDDTAEEYDIDDVSESSPSIAASDPPAPAGGIPSMSTKATSPISSSHSGGPQQRPSLATAGRSTPHRPDFELASNASSVSVDIQDDDTERYHSVPPKGRGRSRSRARLQQEQRDQGQRGPRGSGGGATSVGDSDDDKSRDRAFAVLGHDDDDSSQASGTESGAW
ncbi:hypothetical protein JCM10908_000154 [Rhodotorula pacifica]|uniref:uncharacterized protein n=1 Tax=Rhodotorula pacifica TaxID=1495444 RepID=UPI00316C318B